MSESLSKKLSDSIVDCINTICKSLPFTKIYRAKIVSNISAGIYKVLLNGKEYDLPVYGSGTFSDNEVVRIVVPLNDFSDAFILSK